MKKIAKQYIVIALFPFVITLTIEFFGQELLKGGLSETSFHNIRAVLYLLSELILLVGAWKSKLSQTAKLLLIALLSFLILSNISVLIFGQRLLSLIFN